ncbi:hypothetical protein OH76DRAFT_1356199, partial [Lentinus brumalis]
SVFTSPNQRFVPDFAIAHREITTYSDGRWGAHEYSRWPQVYDHSTIHVACIPRQGSKDAPMASVVWRIWEDADWRTKDCGIPRYGELSPSLVHELSAAAEQEIHAMEDVPSQSINVATTRHFLVTCLRRCVDRLRLLPAERSVIISLAAHVQRLILELAGLRVYASCVRERIVTLGDWRSHVLDILGAWSGDSSVVQTLHLAGVPVWFQQHHTPKLAIWTVAQRAPLPYHFSSRPSYPRLILANRDLSGSLNTPGEWQRAMDAMVRRQLFSSRLPTLSGADARTSEVRPAKRSRQAEWSSSLGYAPPAIMARRSPEARPRISPFGRPDGSSRRYVMNPFRQYYQSTIVATSLAWSLALAAVSPLPQPRASVVYYFPPPWLIDDLVGYQVNTDKIVRYMHHMTAIRTFCRTRLLDHSIAGRPLTIAEWRDALWGDYSLDDPQEDTAAADRVTDRDGPSDKQRTNTRHDLKQSLRRLFGKLGSLPSYDPQSTPQLGDIVITLDAVKTDPRLRQRLVWEAHESNWRCELLALDAVMVGSDEWPEFERWTREAHVSEVWGSSRSGLSLCPDVDQGDVEFCWLTPPNVGWRRSLPHLRAFADLLARWPGCPDELRRGGSQLKENDVDSYTRIQTSAVDFYVRTFVSQFDRLPTPPAINPRPVADKAETRSPANMPSSPSVSSE